MADYTNSKGPGGAVFPNNALESSNQQTEPLITASQLKSRFLFGIPLFSQLKDPATGKPQQITDAVLNDIINSSVSQIETEFNIDIFPVKRSEKYPFVMEEYDNWGHFKLSHTPVATIDKLTIRPANNQDVYQVPQEWIETNGIISGQVNIVPIGIGSIYQGTIGTTSTSGIWFMSVLGLRWVPSYWNFLFTTGFPNGLLPRVINDMIGCLSAMQVLSMLAATYAKSNSTSLGLDGMSQSVSTQGGNLFTTRVQELQARYEILGKKLRSAYGNKIFVTSI